MSNERQETIADIVAEMRLGVKDWKGERLGIFDCFANRIEAAVKREREAGAEAAQICGEIGEIVGRATREESSQVGNAAAMREALLRCDAIAQMPEIREYLIVKDMRNLIKKALSAPPRNCDRSECATTKSAQDVWRNEDGGKTAYYEWLLATYTTGEANGSK